MFEMQYVGIIYTDNNKDYGISFPDFPGCVSAGSNVTEAYELGKEALQFHIDGMIEDGDCLPDPTGADIVLSEHSADDGFVSIVFIEAADTSETVRINLTVKEHDLRRIDKYAEDFGIKRSQLFVNSTLELINYRNSSDYIDCQDRLSKQRLKDHKFVPNHKTDNKQGKERSRA